MNIDPKKQDQLVKMFDVLFPNCKIYLFGSYARGTQKVSSDIDLAIDAGRMLMPHELGQAFNIIEALNFVQDVELVDLNGGIPQKLTDNILQEGVVWKE